MGEVRIVSQIEFKEPLFRGKKSVILTSFISRDRWRELKKKYHRILPIFTRSPRDAENLKEFCRGIQQMRR